MSGPRPVDLLTPIIGGPTVPATLLRRAPTVAPAECDAIAAAYTVLGEPTSVGNLMPFA